MTEEYKNLNIYQRMLKIQTELQTVAKKLNVNTGKGGSYKAVSERDVIDAIKPLENKYGIYSYPAERSVVDSDLITTETQYGQKNSFFLRIETKYVFINVDNPSETLTVVSYGDGIDSGDKATGKAMTYGDKYALMKAYKISTGEDPDKDPSPEFGYKKKVNEWRID